MSKIGAILNLARIRQPAGTALLFLPGAISMTMAACSLPISIPVLAKTTTLFAAGSVVMRGAGCTINDLWDRRIDAKVERTKNRPLAAKLVTPKEAIAFLAFQLSIGLAVLIQFNLYTIALGALSLIPVTIYPLMKRITNWPQAFLGLTFNWGALVGWSAVAGVCNWSVVLPLYLSHIFWTLFYDSIYALQDRKCDAKIGVKSSALSIQGNTKGYLSFFAVSQIGFLALAGFINGQSLPFYLVSVLGSSLHLMWQVRSLDEFSPADAGKKFKSNMYTGLIVLLGVWLDLIFKRQTKQKRDQLERRAKQKRDQLEEKVEPVE